MNPWEELSQIARTILTMSLAGGIIGLVLFAIRPLIKNRLTHRAQHCLWVLALATFLLPLSAVLALPVLTPVTPV